MANLLVCYFFLLSVGVGVRQVAALSFNYDAFNTSQFKEEADARISRDGTIELLGDESAARARGRVLHRQPFQLWDAATGEAASFSASFNFSIASLPNRTGTVGHGMTFFLAPFMANLPQESYDGCLGLYDESLAAANATVNVSGDASFVAVEFDTHRDSWDPSGRHIGVDVNSVDSRGHYTVLPDDGLVDAGVMSATVDYDNTTGRLDVELSAGTATYTLSAAVDLRNLLPEQVTLGFSAATGDKLVGNHTVLSCSFHSTLATATNFSSLPSPSPAKKLTRELTAGVAAAAAALALLLLLAMAALLWRAGRRRRQRLDEEEEEEDSGLDVDGEEFESGAGPRPIPYAQLAAATRVFAEEGKLGQGGSGSVYRGHVKELGRDVAIKVFARGASLEGRKEYRSEVTVISRLRHRNLVQLIGWCHGRRRLLLVYELVHNGSLDGYLHGKETLTWPMRYNIIVGLASAVLYLHQEWDQCVVHGDIKPSNIMLDESFNTKLGDFGLARLIDHGMSLQTMTAVAGTPGYLDPECVITGKASTESDIFSFGVVLLEVACGRRPMEPPPAAGGEVFRLVEWAWELHGAGAALDATDERLRGVFDRWEMERVVAVGLWCAHPDPKARPAIRQAAEALQSRKFRMPVLPPRMPVAFYLQPFGPSNMKYAGVSEPTTVGSYSWTSHATEATQSSSPSSASAAN